MKFNRLTIIGATLAFSFAGPFTVNKSMGMSAASLVQDKWQVASIADAEQFKNPAVPVVVVRLTSGLSDADGNSKKQFLVKEVIVENRSNKEVSQVTLRWVLSPMNNRLTTLSRGGLAPQRLQQLDKQLLAGQRQTLKLSHPQIGKLIDAIPNLAGMGSEFAFVIGVAEVTFDDGTTWKEVSTDVMNKSAASKE